MVLTSDGKQKHKRSIIIGSVMFAMSVICIVMTIIFIYVNNDATRRLDEIRRNYQQVADRRDARVSRLAEQVGELQKKVDNIPDRTASKTADKVKRVVTEDESK